MSQHDRGLARLTAPTPPAPVMGTVRLPGSKSQTNRELILSALAHSPSTLHCALRSRDTELMARALTDLGSSVDTTSSHWQVTPGDLRGPVRVDCGLAGTVMRFVPPTAALATGTVAFDGDAHARTRPMGEIITGLRALGVTVRDDARGTLPFEVEGTGQVRGGRVVIDASASSQFISALLLSGPRFAEGVEVVHDGKPVPSMPHIEMTVACLRARGVEVEDHEANTWRVHPGPIGGREMDIEPDLSNAAPFLAAAAVTHGTVTITGWPENTTQAGDRLREILTLMGAELDGSAVGLSITGPDRLSGIDYDLHDVGELTPAVAALCALADSPSVLRGVAHIRGHETDRLSALAAELGGLGSDVTERDDGLEIRPSALHGGVFRTYADHRMAHAGVIIGLRVPGVEIEDVATTAKTFPDFAAAWTALVGG